METKTVRVFIEERFSDFGVQLSESAILEIGLCNKLNLGDSVVESNINLVVVAIVKFIPSLLAAPASFTENKLSITRSAAKDLKDFYTMKCRELGLEDNLPNRPKVTFW
jgi:hypothetical protein